MVDIQKINDKINRLAIAMLKNRGIMDFVLS